jgi:hypothetical protein
MTNTRQPSLARSCKCCRSLRVLSSNFFFQKALCVLGEYANEHLSWRCQKQPCTRTTDFKRGRTMSGHPGNLRTCRRKRNPIRCSNERMATSGFVFFALIRDMFQLRRSTEIRSIYVPADAVIILSMMWAIFRASSGGTALPT